MIRYRPRHAARRKPRGAALPVALLGLAGFVLWQQRDRLSAILRQLTDPPAPEEAVPDDYDWDRPSVFNSTAMAGPRDGTAGDPDGLDGGSLGTDLGTQGEGAR